MAVPFTKFITRKWAILTSKIDKLFIVIGINRNIHKRIGDITFHPSLSFSANANLKA